MIKVALQDPFSTTFQGAQQGLGTFGQALQLIASQYAERKTEKAKLKTEEWLTMMKEGFAPTKSDRYTPEEIGGMNMEGLSKIIPKVGFTQGQFPKKKGVVKAPSGQFFEPMSELNIKGLKDLKMVVDLRNALEKNKPTAQQLLKMAQQQAFKESGGSLMMGIGSKQQEYKNRVQELYKEYNEMFGVKEGATIEGFETTTEGLEEEIDWQDINF